MEPVPTSFWSLSAVDIARRLDSGPQGLDSQEAESRLAAFGPNSLKPQRRAGPLGLLLSQFRSPIILILILAASLSFFLHDATDAVIILGIVLISGLLGFWQERGASDALDKLLAVVEIKARVWRAGAEQDIPLDEVVPGDVVWLSAGDSVPGDGLLLEARDLFLNEATLTGETFPVEKSPSVVPAETPLAQRSNTVFMGTHVVSGSARAVVVRTGAQTEIGKVSQRLRLRPPETEFERGVRRFGYYLLLVTLLLAFSIFAVNILLHRPVLDSFLFSLALAVGLTPQLLPAIVSVNLAHGARRMAAAKVIVKRLASIENFGSMDVLCSDKTGTLTEGTVRVHSTPDVGGNDSRRVLEFAYLTAAYQTGFANPIDEAVRTFASFDLSQSVKLDEIPYDFVRKRLSILARHGGRRLLATKGALASILAVCTQAELPDGRQAPIDDVRSSIEQRFQAFSQQGLRTLGVAYRDMGEVERILASSESGMTFIGFLVVHDPLKAGIAEVIRRMNELGVALKIISGDNRLVAATVGRQMGLALPRIVTGDELRQMSDEALLARAAEVDLFAEVEPNQKERIILALRKAGKVVGYMGDGINDASALHAADVGISVETAADVAKESADIVLLEHDLGVLVNGVIEGRTTFANTLKYVFMATSANFGNMFSMAGASLFLPFLPLLPKQILLTNLLTDFPEMTIAGDRVDDDWIRRPRRWDIGFIRSFMLTFGPVSSIFDFLTFGVLLLVLHANPDQFRTGWFLESVVSAALIVLVVRTRQPFFRSRPARSLLLATLVVIGLVVAVPWTPLAGPFGFSPLPAWFLATLLGIIVLYVAAAEAAKAVFYRSARGKVG